MTRNPHYLSNQYSPVVRFGSHSHHSCFSYHLCNYDHHPERY